MIAAAIVTVYFAFGALFAIGFAARGMDRIDATSKTIGFRLIALPGSAALWPLLLARWIGAGL